MNAIFTINHSDYAQFGRHLQQRHFMGLLLFAFFLHALAIAIYAIIPTPKVQEIPVRVMKVKLGDGGQAGITSADVNRLFAQRRLAKESPNTATTTSASPTATPLLEEEDELETITKRVETSTPAPVKKQEATPPPPPTPTPAKTENRTAPEPPKPTPAPTATPKPAKPKPVKHKAAPKPAATPAKKSAETEKRYIRESETADSPLEAIGNLLGNSQEDAATIQSRYTQKISLWIDKHKVYPERARAQGEGGKVIVRIRINRQGRILRYMLEESSGSESIDRAISQMISAANPLPSVPVNYPDNRPYLEFLIPINFIP